MQQNKDTTGLYFRITALTECPFATLCKGVCRVTRIDINQKRKAFILLLNTWKQQSTSFFTSILLYYLKLLAAVGHPSLMHEHITLTNLIVQIGKTITILFCIYSHHSYINVWLRHRRRNMQRECALHRAQP